MQVLKGNNAQNIYLLAVIYNIILPHTFELQDIKTPLNTDNTEYSITNLPIFGKDRLCLTI